MKRALKIILPIALVLLVLAGTVLFFLIFRADQTAAFCVSRAEHAAAEGNYDRAVSWYLRADRLAPHNTEIRIPLAEAYAGSGNYTRAEYTLVSAISEDPADSEYYLALSRVYVAQGKLLDAEQMLNRISNEQAQAEIEALRPAEPVFSQASGSYNTLLPLSLGYDSGTAYLTLDGSYPCEDDAYTGTVTLQAGTTEVIALVVGENGLVSRAAYASYTIGRIVGPATFVDSAVEDWVRYILGVDETHEIMTDELWDIQALYLPEGVESLEDLQYFPDLAILSVQDLSGVDFAPVRELTQLTYLNLDGCALHSADLQAIGELATLEELHLSGCGISNLSSLEGLTALRVLDLSGNSIVSIAPLASLTGLEELHLDGNAIDDVSALAGLTALRVLDLSGNNIADISVLAGCAQLQQLNLSNNALQSIDVLAPMTTLTHLQVDYNQLTELPYFDGKGMLQQLSATHNQLTDAAGVCDLLYLNYIDLDYNNLSNLDYLSYCTNLVQVNAFGNPISDVQALLDRSILVNYDPTYAQEADATDEEAAE